MQSKFELPLIENGILLIDKPAGITSFGVVNLVRKYLTTKFEKKIKVGHTGTLDPSATGLMILVIGQECKKANNYSKLDKTYEANIILGETSTTGDSEGEINQYSNNIPTLNEIEKAVKSFVGEIEQTPPVYSAIKINGKRAYELARKGYEFEIPSRKVKIYSIEILNYDYPYLNIRTEVSSGTYIRTLAQDIGISLGTGAYCKQLRRISIDRWTLDSAVSLTKLT